MSIPGETNASEQTLELKSESQLIKVKLRIHIVIVTIDNNKQEVLARQFREGRFEEIESQEDVADELMSGTVSYEDEDEGVYVCYDETFIANENSPKSMQNVSKAIDNYIKGFCVDPNISEVVVCLLLPYINQFAITTKAYLHSFWISSIQQGKAMTKIVKEKSMILFYAIREIGRQSATAVKKAIVGYPGSEMSKTDRQIAALMSYYVYYYIDLYENKDWRLFLSDRLYDDNRINKYLDIRAEQKFPKEKTFIGKGLEVAKKILFSVYKVSDIALNFIFGYGYNLENRIYSRIADVYDVIQVNNMNKPKDTDNTQVNNNNKNKETDNDKNGSESGEEENKEVRRKKTKEEKEKEKEEKKIREIEREINKGNYKTNIKTTIHNVLDECKKIKGPVSLADFFDCCGYWSSIKEGERLKKECEKWTVSPEDAHMEYISGFGGMLFKKASDGKGKDSYIYVFKGTDFDSLFRDWIMTNVLQGLTGFSQQHSLAVRVGKYYDKRVGNTGDLWFAGHSLGGGLASAAVLATDNRTGVTFNAAGLNVIGSKISQLFSNPSRILLPEKDWKRVTPYRIRGEVLDRLQQIMGWSAIPILERGYGLEAIELDIKGIHGKCAERHGINNFLYSDVLSSIDNFTDLEGIKRSGLHNKNIKIKSIKINTANLQFKA